MPIGAWAHAQYWQSKANVPPAAGASGAGGYVPWQTTPVLGSLFGGLQAWFESALWAWRAWRMLRRLRRDERGLVADVVLRMLESPDYIDARQAVAATANILGVRNNPTAWQSLVNVLKPRPGWTENHWRHFQAIVDFDARRPNTLSNPQKNLLVELAYMGYALKPVRTPR